MGFQRLARDSLYARLNARAGKNPGLKCETWGTRFPDEPNPHLTRGNVLDDLGCNPSEALEIKVKAVIYRELLQYIREQDFTQQKPGALLSIHQSDVSNLLNGRVSKFSVSKLIKFAGKLNLGAEVTLTRPRTKALSMVSASTKQRKRAAALV